MKKVILLVFTLIVGCNESQRERVSEPTQAVLDIDNGEAIKRRNRQYKRELNQVKAMVLHYKVGLLGGLSNVSIQLKNPTSIYFESVMVEATYHLQNGNAYVTEFVEFTDVEPNSTKFMTAPNSSRGTSLVCAITAYHSEDLPPHLNRQRPGVGTMSSN